MLNAKQPCQLRQLILRHGGGEGGGGLCQISVAGVVIPAQGGADVAVVEFGLGGFGGELAGDEVAGTMPQGVDMDWGNIRGAGNQAQVMLQGGDGQPLYWIHASHEKLGDGGGWAQAEAMRQQRGEVWGENVDNFPALFGGVQAEQPVTVMVTEGMFDLIRPQVVKPTETAGGVDGVKPYGCTADGGVMVGVLPLVRHGRDFGDIRLIWQRDTGGGESPHPQMVGGVFGDVTVAVEPCGKGADGLPIAGIAGGGIAEGDDLAVPIVDHGTGEGLGGLVAVGGDEVAESGFVVALIGGGLPRQLVEKDGQQVVYCHFLSSFVGDILAELEVVMAEFVLVEEHELEILRDMVSEERRTILAERAKGKLDKEEQAMARVAVRVLRGLERKLRGRE
jgi:hypothetical protein